MDLTNRNFLISSNHRRIQRLWQFVFTGWGLVLIAALIAGSIITKNLSWIPISGISISDITQNQFKMTNPAFSGLDKDGNPFVIKADIARQEYDAPDFVFLDNIRAKISRIDKGRKITDNITAKTGKYNKVKKDITLVGNVRVDSSNGDKLLTDQLVIKL
ncbi:MAG: LPS export ABC transporter periplasmic protein LptC [Alphaproteobacteria bacterium]|nr:LPS export ABC transporter periplasmic protein LptC [Alphaproteobacteria bacterium]